MDEVKQEQVRLIGEYETVIDGKGRVGLGRYAGHFGGALILVLMQGYALAIRPDVFDSIAAAINRWTSFDQAENVYKLFDTELQLFKRHFFSNAVEVTTDSQGRLTIPKRYREALHLVEDVVWVGTGDVLELWQQREFEQSRTLWEHKGGPERVAQMLRELQQPERSGSGPAGDGAQG